MRKTLPNGTSFFKPEKFHPEMNSETFLHRTLLFSELRIDPSISWIDPFCFFFCAFGYAECIEVGTLAGGPRSKLGICVRNKLRREDVEA